MTGQELELHRRQFGPEAGSQQAAYRRRLEIRCPYVRRLLKMSRPDESRIEIFFERVDSRLDELWLPMARAREVLLQALRGFQTIYSSFRQDFGVNAGMIAFLKGEARVWLHPDPASNTPLLSLESTPISQENRLVQMIIQAVEQRTLGRKIACLFRDMD